MKTLTKLTIGGLIVSSSCVIGAEFIENEVTKNRVMRLGYGLFAGQMLTGAAALSGVSEYKRNKQRRYKPLNKIKDKQEGGK